MFPTSRLRSACQATELRRGRPLRARGQLRRLPSNLRAVFERRLLCASAGKPALACHEAKYIRRMIIDAHGHYTTVPGGLRVFRALQISNMGRPRKGAVSISDDEIRTSLEKGQIKLLDERGIDV